MFSTTTCRPLAFLPTGKTCILYILIFFLTLQEFEDDYTEFKGKPLDLDRHLASVLCVGFCDCSGLESVFKVGTHTSETVRHLLLEKQFCALLKLYFMSR